MIHNFRVTGHDEIKDLNYLPFDWKTFSGIQIVISGDDQRTEVQTGLPTSEKPVYLYVDYI